MNRMLMLVCALIVAGAAQGQSALSVDYASHNLHATATTAVPAPITDFETAGNLVYALDNAGGLTIFDYSDPDLPVSRGSITLPGAPYDMVRAGGRLWIAIGDTGLVTYAIEGAELGSPIVVPLPGSSGQVAADGATLAVAAGADGLHILDISDPLSPVLVTTMDLLADAYVVTAENGYVYVGTTSGIAVVDVRVPTAPQLVAQLAASSASTHVLAVPGRLYASQGALQVYDLADPSAPVAAGRAEYGASFKTDFAAVGDKLYVSAGSVGVLAYDARDPQAPYLAGVAASPSMGWAVAVVGERVILGDWAGRLVTLAPGDDSPLPVLGAVDLGSGHMVDSVGELTVVGTSSPHGLVVVDTRDAMAPQVLSSVPLPDMPATLGLVGNVAWVTCQDNGNVKAFDLGDPADPRLLTTPADLEWSWPSRWRDRLVVLSDFEVTVYDVSEPEAPLATASSPRLACCLTSFAVVGDRALVGHEDGGFSVVGLALAGDLEVLGRWDDDRRIFALAGEGDRVFCATDWVDPGIAEVSLADPAAPVLVAFHPFPIAYGQTLDLVDGVLHAGLADGGIAAFDAGTPGVIAPLGAWAGDCPIADLAVCTTAAGTALVAVSFGGLAIVPPQAAPGNPAVAVPAPVSSPLVAAPNPFNPAVTLSCTLPRSGAVNVVIHDLAGRRVAILADAEHTEAGPASWTWRGTDEVGRPVPSGVYFAEVVGPGLRAVRKVALVR